MGTPHTLSVNPVDPALAEAIAGMVSIETLNGRWRVGLPVMCCTGSCVDVTVFPEGGSTYLVTDDGAAFHEISSGFFSERSFVRVAKDRAERAGARFDGHSMLFMRVSADQLRGAILAMGSLVKDVVDSTIEHSIKTRSMSGLDAMHARLEQAFPAAKIEIAAKVSGDSTAVHTFDALVEVDSGLVLFEYFTKGGNSINAAYTKMSDVARLDDAPRVVGVTRHLKDIGPRLMLLSSVAKVIEVDSSLVAYERLAA